MISIEKEGPDKLVKQSFPLRFGKYSEIKTPDFEFCFNLNGEIKSIRGFKLTGPIRQNNLSGRSEMIGFIILLVTKAAMMGLFPGWGSIICPVCLIPATRYGKSDIFPIPSS